MDAEIKKIEDKLIDAIWAIEFDFGDYYDHSERIRELVFNAIHEAFGDKEEKQEEPLFDFEKYSELLGSSKGKHRNCNSKENDK